VLDSVVVCDIIQSLVNNQTTQYLVDAAAAHSGDWLNAVPISACWVRLNDEAVRVAVGLRLDTELCQPYHCVCMWCIGRQSWIPCTILQLKSWLLPAPSFYQWFDMARFMQGRFTTHGLLWSDDKRPDGLTLIPWRNGRCVTWEVKVADTVAPSYLSISSSCVPSAAEAAAKRKEDKYTEIACNFHFFPIAFEIFGTDFPSALGHRISSITHGCPTGDLFLFPTILYSIQQCMEQLIFCGGPFVWPGTPPAPSHTHSRMC